MVDNQNSMQSSPTRVVAAKIIRFEVLWLLLISPFLFFPGSGRGLALIFVPFLWLARYHATRRIIPRTPLDVPICLLLFMVAVSLLVTPAFAESLPKVTGVVLGIAIYYGLVERMARCREERTLWEMIGFLIVALSGVAFLALFGTDWGRKFLRIATVTNYLPTVHLPVSGQAVDLLNPNSIAGALLFGFPLLLLLILHFRSRRLPLPIAYERAGYGLLWLAGLIIGAVLLLSQSRGAYLALAICFLALILITVESVRYRLAIIGIVPVIAVTMGWFATSGQPQLISFSSLDRAMTASEGRGLDSLASRIEIWSRAVYTIKDFPFTGVGMGMFRQVAPLLYPLFLISPAVDIGHAHNHLLAAAVDLGLPGLIAYLSIWLSAGLMCWQVYRQANEGVYRLLALGLGMGMLTHSVWGLFDSNVLGSKLGIILWPVLAAITSLHHLSIMSQRREAQVIQTVNRQETIGCSNNDR